MKIDLEAKKTEGGWQQELDKFVFAATPRWFEWLGWVLILGALAFLAKKVDFIAIKIILGLSGGLFALYFVIFFYQFELQNIPFIKNSRIARLVSITLSALIGIGLCYLFFGIIKVLEKTGS